MLRDSGLAKRLVASWNGLKGRFHQKSINNAKIVVLLGLVSILVLRGTIGYSNYLEASKRDAESILKAKVKAEHKKALAQVEKMQLQADAKQLDIEKQVTPEKQVDEKLVNGTHVEEIQQKHADEKVVNEKVVGETQVEDKQIDEPRMEEKAIEEIPNVQA